MTTAKIPPRPTWSEEALLETWIAHVGGETSTETEREQRRLVDAQVVDILRADDFEGPLYDEFEAKLVTYASAVVEFWVRTGQILRRAAERGRAVPEKHADRLRRSLTPDDLPRLVAEVVGEGFHLFRTDGLIGGKWKPSGGASLRTYLTNACAMRFKDVLRRWTPDRPFEEDVPGEIDSKLASSGMFARGADELVIDDDLRGLLDALISDRDTRQIIWLRCSGVTSFVEIAHRMGPGWDGERVRARVRRLAQRPEFRELRSRWRPGE